MAEESDENCQNSKQSSDKSPKQQLLCKAVEGLRDAFHVCLVLVSEAKMNLWFFD